jgi:hypothetical protein
MTLLVRISLPFVEPKRLCDSIDTGSTGSLGARVNVISAVGDGVLVLFALRPASEP